MPSKGFARQRSLKHSMTKKQRERSKTFAKDEKKNKDELGRKSPI
jgi:hypothetical protein